MPSIVLPVLLFLCGLIQLCERAAASTYELQPDIVYDVVTERDGDGVQRTVSLMLDFYRPVSAAGPMPLVVYVHGGCFVTGTKSGVPSFIRGLTGSGIAVASVEYRMARDPRKPAAGQQHWPYPAALKDVQQAVRFLRQNKDRFGLDPSRIAVHGESTGGYFAAALGVLPLTDRAGRTDAYSVRVGTVSDWYGRTDFTLPKSPNGWPCHEFWLAKPLDEQSRPAFEQAGIIPHVDGASARRFLIIHGNLDPQVDIVHSTSLWNRLRAAGIPAVMYVNEGRGHQFNNDLAAQAVTRRFLLEALRPFGQQPVLSRLRIDSGRLETQGAAPIPAGWQTDRHANPNAPGRTTVAGGCLAQPIANAAPSLAQIYRDIRFGKAFGYRIPVTNGAYRVRLHFAECRYTKIGQRRFDVGLFGVRLLRGYDTLRSTRGRVATADIRELHAIVSNGRLDLDFATTNNADAYVSAVQLERLF
ncbi:MAG TPA: alpha/beta hydrolase fold domain-containing protein [Geminicoccus sp.]|jgi:acetyl esterase/lipase|uniref:alpha/beta hydrolase fold domain-containing protein n=1 Tax=Geminicoccus sp. TaxID=2024832 RepID=UPI002E35ECA8|nr:alpha/beta hydrolase fold domain-containing protein [Geminicoccus sp.]HEX2528979.1 alpha/beta hydrolase fold domain-containing protein [Geminicoccus sp.]